MTDPIPFSSVDFGARARSEYHDIDLLADDIEESGLIVPLVLTLKTLELVSAYEAEFSVSLDPAKLYLLAAGGRRYWALDSLETQLLFHGSTSDPARPGFVLRTDSDLLGQLLIESKENLNRQDLDWRDQMKLMVRTYRLAKREANEKGIRLSARDFGTTLGVSYQNLEIAERVYNHFLACPNLYKDVDTISGSLAILLRSESNEVTRIAATRSLGSADPKSLAIAQPASSVSAELRLKLDGTTELPPGSITFLPGQSTLMQAVVAENVIELSRSFFNCESLAFMESQPAGFCDHIICDPDYAIDVDVLDSSPHSRASVAVGVPYESASQSLHQLYRFINLAFRSIREHGFLCFWYALDHHEKLQEVAKRAGFRVQAHPIIWNKMDFRGRSNAAPHHNFPKSTEFCMICRKPGSILAKVQNTNVFTTTAGDVTRALNHPFAKPFEIWRWLYAAVSVKGQIVFDPFVGVGSSAIEAISYGLRPIGCEINTDLYNNLICNLQAHYVKLLGPQIKFS